MPVALQQQEGGVALGGRELPLAQLGVDGLAEPAQQRLRALAPGIALAALLPLLAAVAIRAGWVPARVWIAVVLLQGALVGSAWLALETGESEEERVEHVVPESRIEAHEEAAERLIPIAAAALGVTALGLLGGALGTAGRTASLVAMALVLGATVKVGHSGGELVYRHGAAQAYAQRADADGQVAARESRRRHHD